MTQQNCAIFGFDTESLSYCTAWKVKAAPLCRQKITRLVIGGNKMGFGANCVTLYKELLTVVLLVTSKSAN